jgi:flavin-dependent dehydrogenase
MKSPSGVAIIGAGPAGCAAALAALAEHREVTLYEKSRFPRHKVCGEFFSPEIADALRAMDVWDAFCAARPARITHAVLHLGRFVKRFELPRVAYGISRFAFDDLLLRESLRRGATLKLESARDENLPQPCVVAHGRHSATLKGERLFGFKAHFRGDVPPAVELFFSGPCYMGISPIEDGGVNVCGLAPEALLKRTAFDPLPLLHEALLDRLRGLERKFDWLITGPLVFRAPLEHGSAYPAGDALGFVDPFTGSGILAALMTGRLAGQAASRGIAVDRYLAMCRSRMRRQFLTAAIFRQVLRTGMAGGLMRLVPGAVLYSLTRPAASF